MDPNLGDNGLDPETENAVRDVMDQAEQEIADASMDGMAVFIKRTYDAFRRAKFSRRQAFALTVTLFKRMVG